MTSEEIASADSLLTENAALRTRILEWEDAYDRLAGAFDLHMAICECQSALSDYAGGYYDVVLGELAAQAERAETARKAWTDLGARAEADSAALKGALNDLLHEVRHTLAGRSTRPDLMDAERDALEVLAATHPGAPLLTALQAARHALLSYAHGNSAPALAEEVAAQIEEVIGE